MISKINLLRFLVETSLPTWRPATRQSSSRSSWRRRARSTTRSSSPAQGCSVKDHQISLIFPKVVITTADSYIHFSTPFIQEVIEIPTELMMLVLQRWRRCPRCCRCRCPTPMSASSSTPTRIPKPSPSRSDPGRDHSGQPENLTFDKLLHNLNYQ